MARSAGGNATPSTHHQAVRNLLLARAAGVWRDARPGGRLGRLFARLVRYRPPDALWVAECAWDGESNGVDEQPVGTWAVDDRGVMPGDFPEPPWAVRGMYFTVFRIWFGIAPGGRRALWSEMRGPRAGGGFVLTLAGDGEPPRVTEAQSLWKA